MARPAIEAVFTMWPSSPPSSMRGTNARTPWTTPIRLMLIVQSQSASVPSHARSRRVAAVAATPALLKTTWTRPNVLEGGVGQAVDGVGGRDVGGDGEHLDAGGLDRRLRRGQGVGLDVGEHEVHALGGEAVGGGQPDPARRAGHDGHPILDVLHGRPLSSPAEATDPASRDRDDRAGVGVELVEVLADAGAGAALVGPAGEALVDDRRRRLDAGRRRARRGRRRLPARACGRPCRGR